MHASLPVFKLALTVTAVLFLAACGNTVRGIGRDASNMVSATKQAGNDVARSF